MIEAKNTQKTKLREEIKQDYVSGTSVEELQKKYGKSKQSIIAILVYENAYKKTTSNREKIIDELLTYGFEKTDFSRISTKFLEKVLYILEKNE